MDFGAEISFVDEYKDTEDVYQLEIDDGLANCAKEQAEAWKEAATEEGRSPSEIRLIEDIITRCKLRRDGANATRLQPRYQKGTAEFDRLVQSRIEGERVTASQKAANLQDLQRKAEDEEITRLQQLGLKSREFEEHRIEDTFGDSCENTEAVVIEIGSFLCRAGFAGNDGPTSVFPSIVGRPRHQGVMVGMGQKDSYVGDEAQSKRGILTNKYPIEKGQVVNWDDMVNILHHIFYNELRIAPEESAILVCHDVLETKSNLAKLIQVLFETFNVPAAYAMPTAPLALYASGYTTGVSVEIGESRINVVPVYEGCVLPHAVVTLPFGGRDMTDYLMKIMSERGYSFTTTVERDIVRDIKEKFAFVAHNFVAETQKDPSLIQQGYELPDGQVISIDSELFRVAEVLFQPAMLGSECMGIHEAAYAAIMKVDVDLRKDLYASIVLSGGTSKLRGLASRLEREVISLAPSSMRVRIRQTGSSCATWTGGSIVASLSSMESQWITKADYDEKGPHACASICQGMGNGSGTAGSVTQHSMTPTVEPMTDTCARVDSERVNKVVASVEFANVNHILLEPGVAIKKAMESLTPDENCPQTCSTCTRIPTFNDAVSEIDNVLTWECKTCGTVNTCGERPQSRDEAIFTLMPALKVGPDAPCVIGAPTESTGCIIFCVDISGSMSCAVSGGVSRLDCMKHAVQGQLQELLKTSPHTNVMIITFGTAVTVIGDKGRSIPVESKIFNDYNGLVAKGRSMSAVFTQKLCDTAGALLKKVESFKTSGCTALGPALAVAIGIASGHASSRVVLCTDGAANQGVGTISNGNTEMASTFYTTASLEAQQNNTVISVITCEGQDCQLDTIGTCADITSGQVDIVDPSKLSSAIHKALGPAIVASNVQLRLFSPQGCNVLADWSKKDVKTTPVNEIAAMRLGCVTEDRTLTCNFSCTSKSLAKPLTEDGMVAFQLQIEFTAPDGAQMLYVKTRSQKLTTDREVSEASVQQHVVALSALHRGAALAHSQQYTEARIELIRTLRLLQRTFDIGNQDTVALRRYLAYILQGERLDNFMREALAAKSVLGETQSRDDPASKSMFQMKSLTTAAFVNTK